MKSLTSVAGRLTCRSTGESVTAVEFLLCVVFLDRHGMSTSIWGGLLAL